MAAFLVRRLLIGVLVVFAVATLTFFGIHATGDPITEGLRESGASLKDIEEVKHSLGYDRPLLVQYLSFLAGIPTGDFGISFHFGTPAIDLVLQRLPATLILATAAMVLTTVTAITLGLVAAYRSGGLVDRFANLLVGVGMSVPNFVIGPLLIVALAVTWRRLPASGNDGWEALVMPTLTLSLYPIARVTRMMRASAVRVLQLDYVDAARAKGISERAVVFRHVLRNSLISVITLLGMEAAALIGGAVITENIFGWPGIGSLARQAFGGRDFPVAQAIVVVVAMFVVAINLVTDLIYSLVVGDPLAQHPADAYRPPAWIDGGTGAHLLGTDQLGRDIFTRVVVGLQSSVLTALVAVTIASVLGVAVGLAAGFYGKWIDEVVMRIIDVQMAVPAILLLLLVVAVLDPSFTTVVLALAVLTWVIYVRVTRAEVLSIKQSDMVTGLVAMGASNRRTLLHHVLPNIAGPLIVITTIEFAQVIVAGASLSYLGLGIPPPTPTIGGMISDGQGGLTAGLWWPVFVPGALLAAMVLTVNSLGENLRAYLDPRSRAATPIRRPLGAITRLQGGRRGHRA
jgi:ABC-type dipeptide/oligopeptide/nickel transport system permease component